MESEGWPHPCANKPCHCTKRGSDFRHLCFFSLVRSSPRPVSPLPASTGLVASEQEGDWRIVRDARMIGGSFCHLAVNPQCLHTSESPSRSGLKMWRASRGPRRLLRDNIFLSFFLACFTRVSSARELDVQAVRMLCMCLSILTVDLRLGQLPKLAY